MINIKIFNLFGVMKKEEEEEKNGGGNWERLWIQICVCVYDIINY